MRRALQMAVLSFFLVAPLEPVLAAPLSRNPRIVMVVAPKDFTDLEYADPRAVFEKMGAEVRVASSSREAAISHAGARLKVDLAVAELKLSQFDALVLIGGAGALTYLMDNEALRNLIVAASRSDKVVAAICVAPALLARAGVLRGKSATCYPDKHVVSILKLNGADYREAPVVVSGTIVTANGPESARPFAQRVFEVLAEKARSNMGD